MKRGNNLKMDFRTAKDKAWETILRAVVNNVDDKNQRSLSNWFSESLVLRLADWSSAA